MSNVNIEISKDFTRPEKQNLSQALNFEISEIEQVLNALEREMSEYKVNLDLLKRIKRMASDESVKSK